MPWIEPAFLECTVYFYPSEAEADDGDPIGGTGFVVGVEIAVGSSSVVVPVLVTNKHVIELGNTTVRINTIDGKRDIVPLDSARWYTHPDGDDLAVCPIQFSVKHMAPLFMICTSQFITKEKLAQFEIGPGDEVFIVGRFVNHEGKQRNLPSLRFGNIAQMPWEPIKIEGRDQETFLVEGRSISGYSGSPVFVYLPPQTPNLNPRFVQQVREGKIRFPGVSKSRLGIPFVLGPWLLGVDYCHLRWDEKVWNKITGDPVSEDWFVKSNTGMMGVVPAWKLMDIIEGPEMEPIMKEAKQKHIAHLERTSKTDSKVELDTALGDAHKRTRSGRLSLHPLPLETALSAALQTGRAPTRKHKKPVG